MLNQFKNRLQSFCKKDDGTATVEAVLWLPVFFAFMIAVADASFIFFGQNTANRIVQDANRQLSIGRLQNEEDVEAFLTAALLNMSPNATVDSIIDQGVVTSSVNMPASDLVSVGLITSLVNADVYVTASHYVEY